LKTQSYSLLLRLNQVTKPAKLCPWTRFNFIGLFGLHPWVSFTSAELAHTPRLERRNHWDEKPIRRGLQKKMSVASNWPAEKGSMLYGWAHGFGWVF